MNFKQVRWTQEHAAAEFGINPRTLSARIKQMGIEAGEDRKYSTMQMATAVHGDLAREKIGLTAAERISQEMKNAEADGRLIDVEEFGQHYEKTAVEIVRVIESSKLSDADKDAIRTQLASLHTK